MKLNWIITPEDERRYRDFVDKHRMRKLVVDRIARNIGRSNLDISPRSVWKRVVCCLLTTQQRSGVGSRVEQFIQNDPQLLSFDFCCQSNDLKTFAETCLTESGLRRAKRITEEIDAAKSFFKSRSYQEFESKLQSMVGDTDLNRERAVARLIQERFKGFGPKQSRNLLQWLGLSKYEIPLDSRIIKVLRQLEFPIPLSSTALADEHYYCFVEDALHEMLHRIEVLPCVFDACAFASFERE